MLPRPRPPLPDLTGHGCHAEDCRQFGMFGFGPPKPAPLAPAVRWYCLQHAGEGDAWWSSMRAAGWDDRGAGQRSLF